MAFPHDEVQEDPPPPLPNVEEMYKTYGDGDLWPAIIVMCSSGFAVFKVGFNVLLITIFLAEAQNLPLCKVILSLAQYFLAVLILLHLRIYFSICNYM